MSAHIPRQPDKKRTLNCRGRLIEIDRTFVMGVLNISDDSFYDGGRYTSRSTQTEQCRKMIAEGADIIDVGACSTRPGSRSVEPSEEMNRLRHSLKWLREEFPDILISVDTWRSEVAKMVVQEGGADIINDISGGTMDSEMFRTVSGLDAPYILSHIQGTPLTMQQQPEYRNIPGDMILFLSERIDLLRQEGVRDIIIDPGFGFGKTVAQNFTLAGQLHQFGIFGLPVLAGISRKSMIWKTLNIQPEEALNGTTVLNALLLLQGVDILRVHDVREARECITLVKKYLGQES